jgi:4-hydroxyphenylpyruvate dioxygenase
LEEVVNAAAHAGFRGLELWSTDLSKGMLSDRVADVLQANGLLVSAFQLLRDYEGSPEHQRKHSLVEAERLMSEMEGIGAETLLLCANTARDSCSDGIQIAADLRILADMAAARGMRIAFEPLAWSRWLNRYEDLTRCVETMDHPALGIAVDVFHWFWAATPIEFARRMPIHKCFNFQVCDADPGDMPALQVARHHRLFPGEGVWQVRELVSEFHDLGYSGFFNLEVINDEYKNIPAAAFAERAAQSVNEMFTPLPK